MALTFRQPDALAKPIGSYSQVIEVTSGKLVFIAGQTAVDAQGKLVGKGDIAAQTRQVMENLKTAVEGAGGSLRDIAKLTIFTTDLPAFRQHTGDLRKAYFPRDYPTSTLVEISQLAHPDFLVEIEAVAAID